MSDNITQTQNVISAEELLKLFTITFKETNNDARKQAEKQISESCKNLHNFITLSGEIILAPENKVDVNVKVSIVTYLKNLIKRKIDEPVVKKEELNSVLGLMIPISISASAHHNKIQDIINSIVISLISKQENQDQDILNKVMEFLLTNVDRNKIDQLLGVSSTILSIISAPYKIDTFRYILEPLNKILDEIKDSANDLLSRFTAIQSDEDVKVFLKVVNTKKNFLHGIFLILMKLGQNMKKEKIDSKDIFEKKYLDEAISTIFYQSTNGSFVSFTKQPEVDKTLNGLKCKAFTLISYLVQNEGQEIKSELIIDRCSKLFTSITDGFKVLISEHYTYLSKMGRDEKDFPDNEYNSIIFQANLFISRFLIREPIVSNMNNYIKAYVHDIIFPLLVTTEKEYERLKVDGDEHLSFNLDLLNEFVSINIILAS